MTITKSTIEKLQISGCKNLESINVFAEDFGPNRGKITIETSGDCWSYFWSNTGHSSIKDFFLSAETDYLVRKFKLGIEKNIPNLEEESLIRTLQKHIFRRRRDGNLTKSKARNQYFQSMDCNVFNYVELYDEIIGDDFHEFLPQVPNPDYNYLHRVVEHIKDAFRMEKEGAKTNI